MVFIVTAVLFVLPAVVFVAVVSTVVFLIILLLTHHHVDQEEKEKKKRSVGWKPHPYLNSDQTPSFPPPRLTSSDQTVSSPQEPKAHCAPNPPTPRFSPIVVRSQLHWEEPTSKLYDSPTTAPGLSLCWGCSMLLHQCLNPFKVERTKLPQVTISII